MEPFYHNVTQVSDDICPSVQPGTPSFSGYIGLKGDSKLAPKRSFFWYFEAEQSAQKAPIILTIGGGPGTSGLANPIMGQSHCRISENGVQPNPHRWTEKFNLLALDHPIGVGFSYGQHVNNSREAAYDVYDFLQKFYRLYPHLASNQFVISGGSYGGVYVPNIATVIHEQNQAVAKGQGQPGAIHINLESVMVSNPLSDPLSWFRWNLHYRCELSDVYNSTTCSEMYGLLPQCLESIEMALQQSSVATRTAASDDCFKLLMGDTHGTVLEDVRKTCDTGSSIDCFPEFGWLNDFFHTDRTKWALGVPHHLNFTPVSTDIDEEFSRYGDIFFPHHRLYEPLLEDGIRVLHHIGSQDASCGWPGVLSFLKLLRTSFQDEFLTTPDTPWPSKDNATITVRAVGPGAGNMTYLTYAGAGHFVVLNQPALTKHVVEHWILNIPFL
ncbi:Alpha/Beta hydrolase protein [Amylostereum chailletii]|nr:Alpha/Beta hydrolase protein [Amylostereum chailletii]